MHIHLHLISVRSCGTGRETWQVVNVFHQWEGKNPPPPKHRGQGKGGKRHIVAIYKSFANARLGEAGV